MRKWVLLTDPDDKMAGVKVRTTWKENANTVSRALLYSGKRIFCANTSRVHCTFI